MAMNPEEWKAKRERREKLRAQQRAKKRKMLKLLAIVCGALLLCGGILYFAFFRTTDAEPAAQTPEQTQQTPEETTQEKEEAPKTKTIRIAAAGDVNVTDRVVSSGGMNYDFTPVFMEVAHLLADADISVVNLEGNLCGAPYGTESASAPQGLMEALDRAGVDLVQLANSYSINKGISGLTDTINAVRAAGMEPLGVYSPLADQADRDGYTICTVDGVKVAFVAFTKGMDGMALPTGNEDCVNVLYTDYESTYQQIDRERITQVLEAAQKENPDIVIAMLHWGSEYNDTISASQEDIVELLQANGVDAVIGTHPHYVQQITFDEENNFLVAYSLGDLISDGERSGTQYSIILNLEITKDLRTGKAVISDYYYVPIYTVAEPESPLRVVRIAESLFAYESYFIGRVNEQTYGDMQYALERITARTTGAG